MRTSLGLTPLLLALASPLAGCASLRNDFQTITVESQPAGARVLVDGELVGTTPTDIDVTCYERHDVRVELGGYPPREFRLKNTLQPLLLLNFALLGGAPYGLALDFMTGAWNDYLKPSAIRVQFPQPPAGAAHDHQPTIGASKQVRARAGRTLSAELGQP